MFILFESILHVNYYPSVIPSERDEGDRLSSSRSTSPGDLNFQLGSGFHALIWSSGKIGSGSDLPENRKDKNYNFDKLIGSLLIG